MKHVLVHHVSSIKEKDRGVVWKKKNHLEQGYHENFAKWFYVVQVKLPKQLCWHKTQVNNRK